MTKAAHPQWALEGFTFKSTFEVPVIQKRGAALGAKYDTMTGLRLHNGDKRYVCLDCPTVFLTPGAVLYHRSAQHPTRTALARRAEQIEGLPVGDRKRELMEARQAEALANLGQSRRDEVLAILALHGEAAAAREVTAPTDSRESVPSTRKRQGKGTALAVQQTALDLPGEMTAQAAAVQPEILDPRREAHLDAMGEVIAASINGLLTDLVTSRARARAEAAEWRARALDAQATTEDTLTVLKQLSTIINGTIGTLERAT